MTQSNWLSDSLIWNRVVYLINSMDINIDLVTNWCPDYYSITRHQKVSTGYLQLKDNTSITLVEEYEIINEQLLIVHYVYIWRDSNDEQLLRADNSRHHDVITKPHHIHDFRFGREIIRPFFGQDAANPDITQFFMYMHRAR